MLMRQFLGRLTREVILVLNRHDDIVEEFFKVGLLIKNWPDLILNDLRGDCSKTIVANNGSQGISLCKPLKIWISDPHWHWCCVVLGSGKIGSFVVRLSPQAKQILLFFIHLLRAKIKVQIQRGEFIWLGRRWRIVLLFQIWLSLCHCSVAVLVWIFRWNFNAGYFRQHFILITVWTLQF